MPYQFRGQHRNEEVLLVTHKHPFVLLRPFLVSGLILIVPVLVDVFVSFGWILSISMVVCWAIGATHALLAWFSWQNSLLVLTNERVVQLEQRGLLHREFMECGLESIQQVSHEVRGLLGTLWGYGSIVVHTGASQKPFDIPDMPDPYEIQQEIQRALVGEVSEEM